MVCDRENRACFKDSSRTPRQCEQAIATPHDLESRHTLVFSLSIQDRQRAIADIARPMRNR